MNGQITDTCTAGALVRRQVRVALDVIGLDWREHKGLFESTFVVTGTTDQMRRFGAAMRTIDAS